jgi:hypothetical protein
MQRPTADPATTNRQSSSCDAVLQQAIVATELANNARHLFDPAAVNPDGWLNLPPNNADALLSSHALPTTPPKPTTPKPSVHKSPSTSDPAAPVSRDAKAATQTPPTKSELAEGVGSFQRTVWSGFLYATSVNVLGKGATPAFWKDTLTEFLRESGDNGNQIQRLILEQMFLTHYTIGQLQVKGASHDKPEATEVYMNSASKLMAEFRRHADLLPRFEPKSVETTAGKSSSNEAAASSHEDGTGTAVRRKARSL